MREIAKASVEEARARERERNWGREIDRDLWRGGLRE